MNSANAFASGDSVTLNGGPSGTRLIADEMDLSDEGDHSSTLSNGNSHVNGTSFHEDEEMGKLLSFYHLFFFC